MRLLIVEDENDLRNIVKKRLAKEHYSVDACGDGLEAMDYIDMTSYVDDPHTCRVESVIYEHATHFVFPESMLKTMLPIGSGIFMKLAFQAARKYPKECQSARMDIDQRVRNAVAEWKSTER